MKKVLLFLSDPYTRCQYWLDEGLKLKKLKKFTEAIQCFDEVLKINHQDPEAWYQKGLALNASDKDTEAMECYDHALDFNPEYTEVWNSKALILKKLGKYPEAAQCFDRILQLNSKNINAWNQKGIILQQLGKEAEAISCFERVFQINPQFDINWELVGNYLSRHGRYIEALEYFNQALKINSNSKQLWCNKGIALANSGSDTQAIECYQNALKIDQHYTMALYNKGISLINRGQTGLAAGAFNYVLKIDNKHKDAWNQKGFLSCLTENYIEATECFDRALQIDAKDTDAWNGKAYVLFYQLLFEEANACFDKALSQNPESSYALQGKGLIAYQKQEFELATEYFQKAERYILSEDRIYELCLLYYQRGKVHIVLDNLEKAKEILKKATDLNPNYIPAQRELSKITPQKLMKHQVSNSKLKTEVEVEKPLTTYHEAEANSKNKKFHKLELPYQSTKNQTKLQNSSVSSNPLVFKLRLEGQKLQGSQQYIEAIKSFDQALEIDPNDVTAWKGKGELLAKQGRDFKAIECFNNVLKLCPNDIFTLEMKGKILMKLGEHHAALNCFNRIFKIEPNLSPTEMSRLFYSQGKAFIGLNELDKAKEAFNKALALDPNYNLAKSELRKLQVVAQKSNTTQLQRLEKLAKESHELDEEIEKFQAEDEEIEKQLKTYHKPTSKSSSQEMETISSPSKTSEKKIIAKSKLLPNPQENLTQLLQETPQESQQHLEKEILILKQQLQNNAQHQKNLEQKIQSLQTASVKAPELANLQKELTDLQTQNEEVKAEREIKAARLAAEKRFKTQPNLWVFYRIVRIRVENRFLGAKDIASEFPKLGYTGTFGDIAAGVNVFNKLLSLIPAIGNSLDTASSIITAGLEKLDEERMTNILKAIADLGTLTDIKRAAESTAHQLTERYSEQLNQLDTESKKPTSTWEKIKEGGKSVYEATKEFVIKEQASSSPKEVAEFAVSQIVSALLDLSIKPDQPLDAQFLQAVCAPPSAFEKIKQGVSSFIGSNEIATKDGKTWQLQDFYRKPGIRTIEGECYAGQGAESELYGYRLGTREEAQLLQWQLVPAKKPANQSELELVREIPKKPVNSYVAVNTQLQQQEVEDLKQRLKAAEEARIKHENDLRVLKETQERENMQREKELSALHSKMNKLLQEQGDKDVSSDVDVGNQSQVQVKAQSQQSSQRSSRTGLSLVETNVKVVEHDQRLRKLEQLSASWMEETTVSISMQNEDEDTARAELFSQQYSFGKK